MNNILNVAIEKNMRKLYIYHVVFVFYSFVFFVLSAAFMYFSYDLVVNQGGIHGRNDGGYGAVLFLIFTTAICAYIFYFFARENSILCRLARCINSLDGGMKIQKTFGGWVTVNALDIKSMDVKWLGKRRLWPSIFGLEFIIGFMCDCSHADDIKCLELISANTSFYWVGRDGFMVGQGVFSGIASAAVESALAKAVARL